MKCSSKKAVGNTYTEVYFINGGQPPFLKQRTSKLKLNSLRGELKLTWYSKMKLKSKAVKK